ncbi:MAG: helix-turn-helix transcriptional regulator [Oscillospiraceae bacterium]|nr:helix-turn-helix transcriptional regulator [Oscillospiraceae bacterium]
MAYYQRLKDLKEDADLTQKQVAELIGVSTNHYGKYERGETDIPLEKAVILAEYYHVSLDYLAGLTNFKNNKDGKHGNHSENKFVDIKLKKSDLYRLILLLEKMVANYDIKKLKEYLKK